MLESTIEKKVSKCAKDTGWLSFKFSSPAQAHVPDRLYIKSGKVIFIEFKAPGKKLRIAQKKRFEQMRAKGAIIYVVDDIEQGKAVLDAES
jgi:hypothetical protein